MTNYFTFTNLGVEITIYFQEGHPYRVIYYGNLCAENLRKQMLAAQAKLHMCGFSCDVGLPHLSEIKDFQIVSDVKPK